MAHYENVIRFCPYTNRLVMASIKIVSEDDIICIHDDNNLDNDRTDVIEWLKAHGLETLE